MTFRLGEPTDTGCESACDFQLGLALLSLMISEDGCFEELPVFRVESESRAMVVRDGVVCPEVDPSSDVAELVFTGVEEPDVDGQPEEELLVESVVFVFFFGGPDRMSSIKARLFVTAGGLVNNDPPVVEELCE